MKYVSIVGISINGLDPFTKVRAQVLQKVGVVERIVQEVEIEVPFRCNALSDELQYEVEQCLKNNGIDVAQTFPQRPAASEKYDLPEAFKIPESFVQYAENQ